MTRQPSPGVRFLRGFVLWAFLLSASFALGALVISPLVHAVNGKEAEKTSPAQKQKGTSTPTANTTNSTPPPVTRSLSPGSDRSRRQDDTAPTITIEPEKPTVQVPETTDNGLNEPAPPRPAARPRSRRTRSNNPTDTTDRPTTPRTETPDNGERNTAPEQPVASPDSSTSSDAATPPGPRRRRSRARTEGETPTPRRESPAAPQKPDGIE